MKMKMKIKIKIKMKTRIETLDELCTASLCYITRLICYVIDCCCSTDELLSK